MAKNKSPLRYPGGKAKLYPYVKHLINKYYKTPPIYIEAYSGGFGLGIELLLNNDVTSVIINDFDYCIFAFWKCVVSQTYHNRFVQLIKDTTIDIETWQVQRDIYRNFEQHDLLEVGFATFYLNRCNRSGIINSNPIGGINQNGNYLMDCRFNKDNLIKLIDDIYAERHRIEVFNRDAARFIPWADSKYTNVFFNFDPPYVTAGPSLYKNSYYEQDHIELSEIIAKVINPWILTYDDDTLIHACYKGFAMRKYNLTYSLQEKRKGEELIIYSHNLVNPPKVHDYMPK